MRKLIIYSLATLMIVCVSALALRVVHPAAADGSGAQKASLQPSTTAKSACGTPSGPTCGSVIFNKTAAINEAGDVKLVAEVAFKNAVPNAKYSVTLEPIPSGSVPSGSDSKVFDGTLATDAQGNGNAIVQEFVSSQTTGASVILANMGDSADFYFTPDVTFS